MRLALLLVWIGIASPLLAAGDGGQPFSWLKLGTGARTAALGGGVAALAQGADALSNNPALLALNDSIDIATQTSFMALDRSLDHIAFTRPVSLPAWRAGMGIGFSRFAVTAPIEVRSTNTLDADREIRDSQFAVRLGLGSYIGSSQTSQIAWGLGFRYMSEQLGESTGTGLALDMGLYWHPLDELSAGLWLADMFDSVSWNTGNKAEMPSTWHLGLAYAPQGLSLKAVAEIEQSTAQSLRPHLGAEYLCLDGMLALRAGLRDLNWCSGLGLNFRVWGAPMSLDYFVGADSVETAALAQRISLNIRFAVETLEAKP